MNEMIDYTLLNQAELNDELFIAATNNDLETVKYLLISPELKLHADINFDYDLVFKKACEYGYVNIVKFILETPGLNREQGLSRSFKDAAQMAYQNGHLNLLKYLIDDFFSEYELDHSRLARQIMDASCSDGNLEQIKYVLSNPKLNQHIDISYRNDEYFITACAWDKLNVVEYFIFELNIPKSEHISNFIEKRVGYENVIEMFSKREFRESLQSELEINSSKAKKVKI